MRTRKYTCALALALALAGCSKQEELTAPLQDGVEVSFCVQNTSDGLSRAALADGGAISFQPGDRISVFDGDGNNCEFTQTGEIGPDGSATFTGKVKMVASSYPVLYPYMPDVATANGSIGTVGTDEVRRPVVIPSSQKAVAGSFDPQAFVSVARSVRVNNSVHSITFHNACALVKFTLPEDLGGFTFEKAVLKSGSRMIAGSLVIEPDGSSSYVGPGSASITMTGTIKAGCSYYFCTIPHDIEGISLSLYHYPDDTEPVVVKAGAEDKEAKLKRNNILDLGTIEIGDLPSKEAGWYGSGTSGDPYQISTVDDMRLLLERLSDSGNTQYRGLCYRLTDDIDCEGDSLIVNGRKVEFCGVFDGNGHTISNYRGSFYSEKWYPSQEYSQLYVYCGLFHRVYRATFKNLTLRPAGMQAELDASDYVSPFISIVDVAGGTPTVIENCRLEGSFNLAFNMLSYCGNLHFGGFVGYNYSDNLIFRNCVNGADFTFSEYRTKEDEYYEWYGPAIHEDITCNIGGFIGCMYNKDAESTTEFDRCRNRGNITFGLDIPGCHIHCGGFMGKGDWGFIHANTYSFTNCVNSGNITVRPGSSNGSAYACGFTGFSEIDGSNHYPGQSEIHLALPRYYNCLNKGDINVHGNGAHAAGFAYYNNKDGKKDNNTQFALCVNIGGIAASAPDNGATYVGAIGCGYGKACWSWWLEADREHPVLSCMHDGVADHCYCYPTINADTPNNRRTGSDGNGGTDVVLDLGNSQWNHQQWLENTVKWVGGSRDKSLDLDIQL